MIDLHGEHLRDWSVGETELTVAWSMRERRQLLTRAQQDAVKHYSLCPATGKVPWALALRSLAYVKMFYGQTG